jgi:hypothetical protein
MRVHSETLALALAAKRTSQAQAERPAPRIAIAHGLEQMMTSSLHQSATASLVDQAGSSPHIALNFFPATFSDSEARVWVGAWTGAEGADALRASIPGLVTWRDPTNGSRVYAWHPSTALTSVGDLLQVTVAFDELPQLFERLLADTVARRLQEIGFRRKKDGFVNLSKPSLLAQIPALAAAAQEPIGIYPKIVTDVFFTKNASGTLVLGLVVDVLYTTRLDVSVAEWSAAGLAEQLRDSYVVLVDGSSEAKRFPHLVGQTIGRIDGFRGDRCVLTDPRDVALVEIAANAIAPEPTRTNLTAYLMARYKGPYQKSEGALKAKLSALVRPQERHRLTSTLVKERLLQPGSNELPTLPGLTVRIGEMATATADTFPVGRLEEPEYSFDRAGNKWEKRVDSGLKRFGPYDAPKIRDRAFRLLVVTPQEHEGQVRGAVQKLLDGIKTKQEVFTGFASMYRLTRLNVTYALAPTSNAAAMARYSQAISDALRDAPPPPAGESKFHLVLAVIRQSYRSLPDSENPYFQTKANALIVEGVPTQAITLEKLQKPDADLQYILNTMALACYAKLGGTSHVLRLPDEDRETATELVFGIGRAVRRSARFAQAEETIGFATVFRANGEYLYNDCTPYSDAQSYERAFEETIKRTVERVAAFECLKDGASLRLIFHVPRRGGRREEHAILNAVAKLPRYRIKHALVHVNEDHHLQIFDRSNIRPAARGVAKPSAAFLPARGLSMYLGPRERLLTFVGVGQYRGYGLPTPLRVTVDKRSSFNDIDYLSQQIFHLSFMNVGSLTPSIGPATIIYAEKVAALTGHLRAVSQWTVELIQQKLGRVLWFV